MVELEHKTTERSSLLPSNTHRPWPLQGREEGGEDKRGGDSVAERLHFQAGEQCRGRQCRRDETHETKPNHANVNKCVNADLLRLRTGRLTNDK